LARHRGEVLEAQFNPNEIEVDRAFRGTSNST
jgi:hypothetical protein